MNAIAGMLLAILAGLLAGSFSLPMKKTGKWAWENTWLVWAFAALLIVPCFVTILTIPGLVNILSKSGLGVLLSVFLFGAGWGLGAVLFGRSIALLGMSLAFAISMGLTISLGSLIPMISNPGVFKTSAGIVVAAGIVIMILGVIVCAAAGNEKEKRIAALDSVSGKAQKKSAAFITGMILCILSGIFNPMINFAFVFGEKIVNDAIGAGASEASAADAIWAVALFGGLITNIIYCSILLTKNKTWANYTKEKTWNHWPLAIMMGVIWSLSITAYGRSAFFMGTLGKSAGWAIYLGFCIFVSNFWGIITGEWKQGSTRPLHIMYTGLTILIAAVIIIGWGNSL